MIWENKNYPFKIQNTQVKNQHILSRLKRIFDNVIEVFNVLSVLNNKISAIKIVFFFFSGYYISLVYLRKQL